MDTLDPIWNCDIKRHGNTWTIWSNSRMEFSESNGDPKMFVRALKIRDEMRRGMKSIVGAD